MASDKPIDALIRETRFTSKTDLARYLVDHWPPAATVKKPTVGSMATYLGRLGEPAHAKWWLDRPAVLDLMDAAVPGSASLVRHFVESPAATEPIWGIPDAADIRLDLEKPPVLGDPDWFELPTDDYRSVLWIEAPPGAGRTLAARSLAARFPQLVTAVHVRVLADAVRDAPTTGWLVVDVAQPDPTDDSRAARALASLGRVIVMAPMPPPGAKRPYDGIIFGQEAGDEEQEPSPWTWDTWQPTDGWGQRLAEWVNSRARSGSIDSAAFAAAVDDLDPHLTQFATPGDLMPILALAWDKGGLHDADYIDVELARDVLRSRLRRGATELADSNGVSWIQTMGLDALEAAAKVRLTDLSVPLFAAAPAAWWQMAIADVAPAPGETAVRDAVMRVAGADDQAERRRQATRAIKELSGPQARLAVRYLTQAEALRPGPDGSLDVVPFWAWRLLAKQYLLELLDSAAPARWGALGSDTQRRELLDRALDGLDNEDLTRLIDRCLASRAPEDFGWVGAVEALFGAVGRRVRTWPEPPHELIASLWEEQRQVLRAVRPRAAYWPVTVQPTHGSLNEFLANCWDISFNIRRVEGPVDGWLLPGWGQPDWSRTDGGSVRQWASAPDIHTDREHWDLGFCRLLANGDTVLERSIGPAPENPHDVPWPLLPHLFLRTAVEGTVTSHYVDFVLFHESWLRQEVPVVFEGLDTKSKRAAASNIFSAIERHNDDGVRVAMARLRREAPYIAEHLGAAPIIEALTACDSGWLRRSVAHVADAVPAQCQHEVLGWLMDTLGDDAANRLISGVRESLGEGILLRIARLEIVLRWVAIQQLWERYPDTAAREARTAVTDRTSGWSSWVGNSSGEHTLHLLDLVEEHANPQDLTDERLRFWLHRVIVEQPVLAARAWKLLTIEAA